MSAFTASGAQRIAECLGPAVLPQVRTSHAGTAKGSALHAFIPAVGLIGREKALAACPEEWRHIAEELELDKLPVEPRTCAHELAMVYDATKDEAREVSRGLGDRSYGELGSMDLAGTADVVGLLGEDVVYVADFKSGFSDVPSADRNLQIHIYALMAARLFNCSSAIVQVIKIKDSGAVVPLKPHELDCFALDAVAAKVVELFTRAAKAKAAFAKSKSLPVLHMGEHCQFCPSTPYCPARMGLARQLSNDLACWDDPHEMFITTPEQAASAWAKVKDGRKLLNSIESAVKDYAAVTPVPLENGKVLRFEEYEGNEQLDGAKAYDVAQALYGAFAAPDAVEMVATKSRIRAMLKENKSQDVTLAQAECDFYAELRSLGGVTREQKSGVREVSDD